MQEILAQYFEEVNDPRSIRNQRHKFITLVGTTLLSVLSGIDSFSGIQDFVEMHFDALKEYFDLSNGVPSHDHIADSGTLCLRLNSQYHFMNSLRVLRR